MKKIIFLTLLFSSTLFAQTGDEFVKYCNVQVDSKDICTDLIVTANPISSTLCKNVELHLTDLDLGNDLGHEKVRLQWKIHTEKTKFLIGNSEMIEINEFVVVTQGNINIICR